MDGMAMCSKALYIHCKLFLVGSVFGNVYHMSTRRVVLPRNEHWSVICHRMLRKSCMGLDALSRAWSLETYLGKSIRSELIYAWSHDMSDELTYSMFTHVQGRGTEHPYFYLTVYWSNPKCFHESRNLSLTRCMNSLPSFIFKDRPASRTNIEWICYCCLSAPTVTRTLENKYKYCVKQIVPFP